MKVNPQVTDSKWIGLSYPSMLNRFARVEESYNNFAG